MKQAEGLRPCGDDLAKRLLTEMVFSLGEIPLPDAGIYVRALVPLLAPLPGAGARGVVRRARARQVLPSRAEVALWAAEAGRGR